MTLEGEDVPVDGLGEELLRIHQESYGATAGDVHVHVLENFVVCFLDELELMPNENFLIDSGRGHMVIEFRSQYQQAIEMTFRAAVERATGRRVVSFVSSTKLSPNYAVEIFRLGPETSPMSDDSDVVGEAGSAP